MREKENFHINGLLNARWKLVMKIYSIFELENKNINDLRWNWVKSLMRLMSIKEM